MSDYAECPCNIILHDENYNGTYAKDYEDMGTTIDKMVVAYIEILRELLDSNNVSGKTADSLTSFVDLAESYLSGCAGEILSEYKSNLNQFIEDIDTVDEAIYE